jgi:hypothetical protein
MLVSLYAFFSHSPKRHIEFQKLAKTLQSKGLKILKNVTTHWISMLSPAVRVINEYKVLLVKMQLDSQTPERSVDEKKPKTDKKLFKLAQANLAYLSDIQILLGLSGLLPLLRSVHFLMQFAQGRDLLVCDYVAAIQICIIEIIAFYVDDSTAFTQDIFWDFKALSGVRHDDMAWVPKALDLNPEGLDYLHFILCTRASFPVTWVLYASITEEVKLLCKGTFCLYHKVLLLLNNICYFLVF